MKPELRVAQREATQVNKEAINRRRKKRLARVIVDEDKPLNSFSITNKIQKIIRTQHKRKKTRKQTQKDEEEKELLAKENRTNRKC